MPQTSFLEAQLTYESLGSINLDAVITNLDTVLSTYALAQTPANMTAVESAFAPIAEYYSKLVDVNETLRTHINKTAKNIADADPRILSEERYSNRIHPEESVMPREASNNFFPELKQSSLPYIISASIFMALLSIFLIFQLNGFSGQINVPPSVAAWIASIVSPAPDAVPFYKNYMVIAGVVTILVTALVIFIILYFQAENTNRSRQ